MDVLDGPPRGFSHRAAATVTSFAVLDRLSSRSNDRGFGAAPGKAWRTVGALCESNEAKD